MSDSAAPTIATRLMVALASSPLLRARSAALLSVALAGGPGYPARRRSPLRASPLPLDLGDAGVDRLEHVLVQRGPDVGRVPARRVPVLVRREELLAHLPRVVEREVVADEPQDLTRHRDRVVGREPRDRGCRVARVHVVELGVGLGLLDL